MKKPILIVGLPRTGSTLLQNLICTSAQVCRLPEMHFLHRFRKDFRSFVRKEVGDLSDDGRIRVAVEKMFSRESHAGLWGTFWRFEDFRIVDDPEFRRAVAARMLSSGRSLGEIFCILLESMTLADKKERCCLKFPVEIGQLQTLLDWVPDARIVHLTRDPRAVAISKTADPGGTAIQVARYPYLRQPIKLLHIVRVIADYNRSARLHQHYLSLDNYYLVRYEDLLIDSKKELTDLFKFLELAQGDTPLSADQCPYEHQPSSLTGIRTKAIDPRAASRWKSAMSANLRRVITVLTRKAMRRFEFDPEEHPIYRRTNEQPT